MVRRAFDFEVEHDGQIIGGDDYARVHQQWDQAGWAQRLHAAVQTAGTHFAGPLASPYEPWHYAYLPSAAATSIP